MIRATELGGRAVVDMDAAEKLGKIDKVILDPDGRRVAGFGCPVVRLFSAVALM